MVTHEDLLQRVIWHIGQFCRMMFGNDQLESLEMQHVVGYQLTNDVTATEWIDVEKCKDLCTLVHFHARNFTWETDLALLLDSAGEC